MADGDETQKEKIVNEQALLSAAGYRDILARHGERNNGIDGLRGPDTIAAEEQFRKEHHFGADEVEIRTLKPNPTPSVPKTGKGPQIVKL